MNEAELTTRLTIYLNHLWQDINKYNRPKHIHEIMKIKLYNGNVYTTIQPITFPKPLYNPLIITEDGERHIIDTSEIESIEENIYIDLL